MQQIGMQAPALANMGSMQGPLSPQPMMQQQGGMMFAPQSPQILGGPMLSSQHSAQLFQFPQHHQQ